MRALIADDELEVLNVVSEMVFSVGYHRIDRVCDGHAAQLLSGIHYDLVLLDINMAGTDGINGVDAAHLIKAFGSQAKIIMMTGYSNMDTNGFYVLSKPFTTKELLAAITASGE